MIYVEVIEPLEDAFRRRCRMEETSQ